MKKLLFVALISLAGNVFSQTSPQTMINTFFTTYQTNAGKAVKDLYETNKWTLLIQEDVDKIIRTVNGFTPSYMGEYYGYEVITNKKFSESFLLFSYMVKYDRQPIRFIFKFYKPKDKWVLYSFALDDDLDDELEESAKLNNINLEKK
jgi:hypothetical protein